MTSLSMENQIANLEAGTHARIDLARYAQNIELMWDAAGREKSFMAVIKANAYGHGAVACARAAVQAGVDYLAVARVSEALQLRRAGVDHPVLVLGGPNPKQIEAAIEQGISVSVGSIEALDAVSQAAQRAGQRPTVHLKVDTGLHRYGALPELAFELAMRLAQDERLDFEGIYGHFSSADESDPAPTLLQIERADRLLDRLDEAGVTPRLVHLPNSAGILSGQLGRSNLVRGGIATYGLAPSPDVPLLGGMKPVMSLRSKVTRAFQIPAGEGVSYGLTYIATHDEYAATVPIGYADGLPRSLSNDGWFLINGDRCPIRGRVCMDQTVVGLSAPASENDDVVLIGDGSSGAMSVDEIAAIDGTINYEIVARLAARVPRVYYRAGEAFGWDDPILAESDIHLGAENENREAHAPRDDHRSETRAT